MKFYIVKAKHFNDPLKTKEVAITYEQIIIIFDEKKTLNCYQVKIHHTNKQNNHEKYICYL